MPGIFKRTVYFWVFFLTFLSSSFAGARVISLEKGLYDESTRPFARIWIDKKQDMTYETAIDKLKNNEFRPLDSLDLPGAFRRGAYVYWIAIIAKNPNPEPFPLLLWGIRLSEDSTWHLRGNRPPEVKKISRFGEEEPYGILPYALRWGWIYPIQPQATDTILIRYYNFKPLADFLPRASDAAFYSGKYLVDRLQENWIFIFGVGALFSVFVFAISIWLYTRQKAFFWYAAFCFSLLIACLWNFDSALPPLYFISNHVEWAYTKMYVHTFFPGICHSLFLYYFFKDQSVLLQKLVKVFLFACALAAVAETVLLLAEQLQWSWVFYWWFRNLIVVYGLVALYFIRKIPGKQAKWVMIGAAAIYVLDVLSHISSQYTSHITMFGMMVDIFCFTAATASRFNQMQGEKLRLVMEQQAYEMEQKREMERMKDRISQDLRNEIAADLHDDVGATLSSISFLGEMASMKLKRKQEGLPQILDKIVRESNEMIQTMRGMIWVIQPLNDGSADFFDKVRLFADGVLSSRHVKLDFRADLTEPRKLSLDLQRNLFLVFKELVINIAKHAGATEVAIEIIQRHDRLAVTVRDNGRGFDMTANGEGNGLKNIESRTNYLGADFELITRPGLGTEVRITVPIA